MLTPNRIFYDPDGVFPEWTCTEELHRSRVKFMPFLVLILLWLGFVGVQSYHQYSEWRQANGLSPAVVDPWSQDTRFQMDPQQVSHFYKMPLDEVWQALDIQPGPGDESLTLSELASKYRKSPEQVKDALNHLNNLQPRR